MKLWKEICTFIKEKELNCEFICKIQFCVLIAMWMPLSLWLESMKRWFAASCPCGPLVFLRMSWGSEEGEYSGTGCLSPSPCAPASIGTLVLDRCTDHHGNRLKIRTLLLLVVGAPAKIRNGCVERWWGIHAELTQRKTGGASRIVPLAGAFEILTVKAAYFFIKYGLFHGYL